MDPTQIGQNARDIAILAANRGREYLQRPLDLRLGFGIAGRVDVQPRELHRCAAHIRVAWPAHSARDLQRLAVHRFSVRQPSLLLDNSAQVGEGGQQFDGVGTVHRFVKRPRSSMQGFGLGGHPLVLELQGLIAQAVRHGRLSVSIAGIARHQQRDVVAAGLAFLGEGAHRDDPGPRRVRDPCNLFGIRHVRPVYQGPLSASRCYDADDHVDAALNDFGDEILATRRGDRPVMGGARLHRPCGGVAQ